MRRATRAFVLFWAALATVAALDLKSLQPQGYVSDFAGVIDAPTRARLEEYCATVERATQAQIAIVTLTTLEGEPVEDVANALFTQWGIGKKGQDNGALFLLVVADRKSRLEIGYGLEPILPDGLAGSILREMRPALRQRDYATALSTATRELGERIAAAKGVSLGDAPRPRRTERKKDTGFPIWPIVAFLVFLFLFGGRGRPRGPSVRGASAGDVLTGMVLGSMMNSGRRGWGGGGGGGFGGFSGGGGGGGFGGFGGGGSGGGGASSDW